ncbi:MAG: hypothetical protein GYA33_11690, partial [Thermogutta sp.]|nr:hypothetical protein [Thermogutta sp.]
MLRASVYLTICLGWLAGQGDRPAISGSAAAAMETVVPAIETGAAAMGTVAPGMETVAPGMETAAGTERGEDRGAPSNAASEQPRDPLAEVLRWMEESEKRLKSGDTGQGTRQLQESVVRRLEELIRQAEDASASSSASAAPSQNSPSQTQENGDEAATETKPAGTEPGEGTAPGGDGGVNGSANDLRMVLQRIWGELPQRERDVLMQQGTESFLPKYRPMIEAYFRRLSEGRSAWGNDGIMTVPRA